MKSIAVLAGVAAFLCTQPAASADEQVASPPTFSSEVSLVLLPVFAVDKDGNAVRGLRAEDFDVREDGRAAEVVSFRYVDTTSAEDQEEIRRSPAARRRFLLLFDKSFTVPVGLNRAQRAALDFVRRRLAESDLAAVATIDVHHGVKLVANFTEDRYLLAHAVETLGVANMARISDPLALAADLSVTDFALAGRTEGGENPEGSINNVLSVIVRRMQAAERQAYRSEVQALVASLGELARGLRGLEGRKQILYFSAGFDASVLTGESGNDSRQASEAAVQGALWQVDDVGRYGDSRTRDLVNEVTRALAGADAVVHTIDVTGLGTDGSLTQLSASPDIARAVPGRESLSLIASETGGRYFRDANDLAPVLEEMERMTSRYYVLGIQPAREKGPGAYHKMKVKVGRKGVRLSHRPGYYERLPMAAQTPLQRRFEAAQLVVTGVGQNDLKFSALCLPFPAAGDKQTLGVVVQVPRDALQWQPGKPLALEAYGYGVAEDGTVYDHFAQLARVDPAQADPEGDSLGVTLFGSLSVPPGRYTLRLMVHERESGSAGAQFLDVTVPPYDARRGFLLPPVVVDEAGRWLALAMDRREGEAPTPFQIAGEPFVPRADFEVQPGKAQKMVLIAYEPELPGDPAADVQIRSSLTDREGQSVPAGVLRVHKVHHDGNGRRTYVLGYTPEVELPGDYTLRIGVGEGRERLEAYSLIRLRAGS